MILILILIVCAYAFWRCRSIVFGKLKTFSHKDESQKLVASESDALTQMNELETTINGLTTISALQEGLIVEHSKTIDNLTRDIQSLKRKFSEIDESQS